MTSEQFDRLLKMVDRYVQVEETKLQLEYQQLTAQNTYKERALAALEKIAFRRL